MKVTVLLGTLKPTGVKSETAMLVKELIAAMRTHGEVKVRGIRLADLMLPNVKGQRPFTGDKKLIIEATLWCDLLIMATPIWWGSHSSAIQHTLEYLDDQDDIHRSGAPNKFLGKQAITVVTGIDDGVQHVNSTVLGALQWMGFTIPGQGSVSYLKHTGRQEATKLVTRAAKILMAPE